MWLVRFKRYDVNNLTKCHDCLAKYYCSGGCPEFRNEKLNCERRVKKYARMFIQKQVRNKHTYCMYSFKLIVYTTNEREEQDYKSIINRFEKEEN